MAKNREQLDKKLNIEFQSEVLPKFSKEQSYLGYEIRIDNICTQTEDLITDFKNTLDKIDNSPLPTSAKLDAINDMCMSKLNFFFPNLNFLEKTTVRH